MIEIKCSKQEKERILNALYVAHICPFDDSCKLDRTQSLRMSCHECRAEHIKFRNDDGVYVTPEEFMNVFADAATELTAENPLLLLIAEDIAKVNAAVMHKLFDAKKEEKK